MQHQSSLNRPVADPKHVALIMDGNGRWARRHGEARTTGHKAGAEALIRTVEAAATFGISHLTVFAFSTENWKRNHNEIATLFQLLRHYLTTETERLTRAGVRFRVLGDTGALNAETAELLSEVERASAGNTHLQLNVALNYGGRQEIVHATRGLAQRVAAGALDADQICASDFADQLFAPDIPHPDVLARTGGERRLSNFLLWRLAYTELVFLETLWPEFDKQDLHRIITTYRTRTRRFGAVDGV